MVRLYSLEPLTLYPGNVIRAEVCRIARSCGVCNHTTRCMAYGLTEGNQRNRPRLTPHTRRVALEDPDILRKIFPASGNEFIQVGGERDGTRREFATGRKTNAATADIIIAKMDKPHCHHARQVKHVPQVCPRAGAPRKLPVDGKKL
ncbi:hypothetical protein ACXGPA_21960 (plasmid) [Enterobacter asburiae]